MLTQFSSQLAFQLASPTSYRRGEEYFNDGAVEKIWLEDGVYKAIVQGTRRYTVSVCIQGEDIKTECTCPYEMEGICKHIVAAILALAEDKKLATINTQKEHIAKLNKADKLITKASNEQIRTFLQKLLAKDQKIRCDFIIFLQGKKETAATVASYQEKIKQKLDELDLKELLEVWHHSGDDYYYDDYYRESAYDDQAVTDIIEPFRNKAQKYAENQNYAESSKIYQAIITTLYEKLKTLTDDYIDLGDWFLNEINEALEAFITVLIKTKDLNIKQGNIQYLCQLFENQDKNVDLGQGNIGDGLKQAITDKSTAEIALRALSKTKARQNLSQPESALLAYLYFIIADYITFERISLDNLTKNPFLSLDLLAYYQKHNRKQDILKTAYNVLEKLAKNANSWEYGGYDDLEIAIRTFLKNVFDKSKEYEQMIKNLEVLFLKSAKLSDYKELITAYQTTAEKEAFLKTVKVYFTKRDDVKTMFKVFQLESKKAEILDLISCYKKAECFPQMVASVAKNFPDECFKHYQEKIKDMLKVADVNVYPQATYHLKQMKQIGLAQAFNAFVNWLSNFYSRRYRFIEQLRKNKLI